MEKKSKLDNLIDSSIQKSIKNKENENNKIENINLKKKSKNSKKHKKDESSGDEFDLPRRRVMTYKELNKRKRVMTKYHKELLKEREEEKLDAMLNSSFNEDEYEDSLKDFVVDEKSIYIDSQITDTSTKVDSSFIDDECEVGEEEIEGSCDDEEMEIYYNRNGIKDFYNDSDLSDEDYKKLEKKTFSDDSHFSSSDDEVEIRRKIIKKRNKFINDEVSLADQESLEDELSDSDYSDLKSFINDNDVTVYNSSDSNSDDEPDKNELDESCIFNKKRKKRKACQLSSDDEEDTHNTSKTKLKKFSSSNESLSKINDNKLSRNSVSNSKSSLLSGNSEDKSNYEIVCVNKIKENDQKITDSENEINTESNFTFESSQMNQSIDSDSLIPSTKIKSKSFISSSESEDDNFKDTKKENKTINITETIIDESLFSSYGNNYTIDSINDEKYGKIDSDSDDYNFKISDKKFNNSTKELKDSIKCKIDLKECYKDKKEDLENFNNYSDNNKSLSEDFKLNSKDFYNSDIDDKLDIKDKNFKNKISQINQSSLFEDSIEYVFSGNEDSS